METPNIDSKRSESDSQLTTTQIEKIDTDPLQMNNLNISHFDLDESLADVGISCTNNSIHIRSKSPINYVQ